MTEKIWLKSTIVPGDFTAAVGMEYTTRVREVMEAASKKDDENVKQPEPFSGKTSKWHSFYKLLVNYLSSKKNRDRTPLGYVIRSSSGPLHMKVQIMPRTMARCGKPYNLLHCKKLPTPLSVGLLVREMAAVPSRLLSDDMSALQP
jgi:hypothetical protein